MKYAVPLLLTLLVLGACSTVPTDRDGLEFVDLINNGEWKPLSEMTGRPFSAGYRNDNAGFGYEGVLEDSGGGRI